MNSYEVALFEREGGWAATLLHQREVVCTTRTHPTVQTVMDDVSRKIGAHRMRSGELSMCVGLWRD